MIAFVEQIFGAGYKKIVRRLWQFLFIFVTGIICVFAATQQLSTIYIPIQIERCFFFPALVITFAVIIPQLLRRNTEAILYATGLTVLVVYGLNSLLHFFQIYYKGNYIEIDYGLFFFLLSLAAILGHRFAQTHLKLQMFSKQLQQNADEREKIMQDLHDGVGGLLTNIKLLSEMAKESSSMDHVRKTLSMVADLSKTSLEEIRNFLDILDDQEMSWQALVADFRHYGVTTIEAHNMEFTMQSNVLKTLEAPSNYMSVNLTKIFREAITNIIKHSNGTAVEVFFDMSGTMLDFTIRDNGVAAEQGRENGHGLENMQKRAKAIGAELEIIFEQSTLVRLQMELAKLQ